MPTMNSFPCYYITNYYFLIILFYLSEEERYCYHAITSVGVGGVGGGVVIFPCYRYNSTKNDVIWLKLSGIVPYGVKMKPIELGAI